MRAMTQSFPLCPIEVSALLSQVIRTLYCKLCFVSISCNNPQHTLPVALCHHGFLPRLCLHPAREGLPRLHPCSACVDWNLSLNLAIFAFVILHPSKAGPTLFFSMTLANSPVQMKQWWGVMSRKQSPLFREDALGSTSLVWTCRRPGVT